jgi:XTP/dITP diphosphohydrolase
MRLSNRIVVATQNRDKIEEFRSLFQPWPEIELIAASDLLRNADRLQYAERFDTYLDNAVSKARLANSGTHYPCLADDSGLEVEGLGGKPGVRSHRYATPRAGVSQDQANIDLLLKELGNKPHEARFVCTLALVIEGILIHATGVLEGKISDHQHGTQGFGYDPVFIPKGSTKTLAEMTAIEKNAISHRAKAVQELMNQVRAHGIVFAKP